MVGIFVLEVGCLSCRRKKVQSLLIIAHFFIYLDGLVGQLKLKNESLERMLKVANQTNNVLQQRLGDLEMEHQHSLEAMDSQIRRLYDTIKRLTEQQGSSPTNERVRARKPGDIKMWNVQNAEYDPNRNTLSVSNAK